MLIHPHPFIYIWYLPNLDMFVCLFVCSRRYTTTTTTTRQSQHPPHRFHPRLQTPLSPSPSTTTSFPPRRKRLFEHTRFGRPFAIVFPALHQRTEQREQVDGNRGRAGLQNDFVVDFGIHVVVDAFADGVWKINWERRVSSDFGRRCFFSVERMTGLTFG